MRWIVKKFDVLITDHIAEEGIEILEKAESINYEIRAGISNADLKLSISFVSKYLLQYLNSLTK